MSKKTVVIIGAGPAGLTAAFELLRQKDLRVVVLESSNCVGGISQTVRYNGNRIDIGGHRFFSKSAWVMQWWQQILPIQQKEPLFPDIQCQIGSPIVTQPSPNDTNVMMVRRRLSRIFYEGKFFDYPLKGSINVALKLGIKRSCLILSNYLYAKLRPINPEKNLEDFIINRFGRKLYSIFFKNYTEKVWGVPCRTISPNWGAQRIKSLSIGKLILHALKSPFMRMNSALSGQTAQTSLIDSFLYPKYGPGQMWETVATKVKELGATIKLNHKAVKIEITGNSVKTVTARDVLNQNKNVISADYVISTMPVKDLINAMTPSPANEVLQSCSRSAIS